MDTYQSRSPRDTIRELEERYSHSKQYSIDSTSKPPKGFRDDVLLKANEALQKSVKFSNNPASDFKATKKSFYSTQDNITNENYGNSRTNDVLNRANEILKKSAHYSKASEFSSTLDRASTLKPYPLSQVTGTPLNLDTGYFPERDRGYQETTVNKYTSALSSAEKANANPRDILSRIDMALQSSSQIPSAANGYIEENYKTSKYQPIPRNEGRASVKTNEFDIQRSYQYETPQRSFAFKNVQETDKYQPSNHISPYVNRPAQESEIHRAYAEALRRSQELVFRNEEELLKNRQEGLGGGERKTINMKASYVMERTTASPGGDVVFGQSLESYNLPPPGIHIQQTQAIKPKFVEEYLDDGTVYRGEKIRNTKQGRGEFIYADGSKYDGEWENDKKNGFGVRTASNGRVIYDGEWKDDAFHGNGLLANEGATPEQGFDPNNFDTLENHWIKYEGEFANGKMHGLGTLTLFNNEKYVGKFKYDKVHGAGVFHRSTGDMVSAEWENNKFVRAT